jgi:hypothetical protein
MMTARSTSLIKLSPRKVRNFPVASLLDAWQRADGGDACGFASRLSSVQKK